MLMSSSGQEPLKAIRNGERVTPTFSGTEMARRVRSLRKIIAKKRVDAVFFMSIHNVNYVGDFLSRGTATDAGPEYNVVAG